MSVPDWIVTQFHCNAQNADINSQLQDELTERRFTCKTGPIFTWEIVDILLRLIYKTKESR